MFPFYDRLRSFGGPEVRKSDEQWRKYLFYGVKSKAPAARLPAIRLRSNPWFLPPHHPYFQPGVSSWKYKMDEINFLVAMTAVESTPVKEARTGIEVETG